MNSVQKRLICFAGAGATGKTSLVDALHSRVACGMHVGGEFSISKQ